MTLPIAHPNFLLFPPSKWTTCDFPAPAHLSAGCTPYCHFCPGHQPPPSALVLLCQFVPPGLWGLRLSSSSWGMLSAQSDTRSGALGCCQQHFLYCRVIFIFYFLLFISQKTISSLRAKCGVCWLFTFQSYQSVKCLNSCLIKRSTNTCCPPSGFCSVENRGYNQPSNHRALGVSQFLTPTFSFKLPSRKSSLVLEEQCGHYALHNLSVHS